jgi:hypothetical protein
MAFSKIKLFSFSRLKIGAFYQLLVQIMEVLSQSSIQSLGVEALYSHLAQLFEQFSENFRHNQTLLQTEQVATNMYELRNMLALLRNTLKLQRKYTAPENVEAVTVVSNITLPCLRNIYKVSYPEVLANSGQLVAELQTPAMLPLVMQLNLQSQVEEIGAIYTVTNELYIARGSDREAQLQHGTATEQRRYIESDLRDMLYSVFPGLYLITTDTSQRSAINDAALLINGLLDSYRYLVSGKHHALTGGGGHDLTRRRD